VKILLLTKSLEEADSNPHGWLWGGSRLQWRK
jgi:acyl-CoA hydrolase